MRMLNLFKPVDKRKQVRTILLDLAWARREPLSHWPRLANLDLSAFTDEEIDKLYAWLSIIQGEIYTITRTRLPRVLKQN
jgi:hypothetical protein